MDGIDLITGGGGAGVGATLGAFIAKWFVSKHDKEISEMKKELKVLMRDISDSKEHDNKRDVAIAVLQTNHDQFKATLEKIDKKIDRIFDKLEKL